VLRAPLASALIVAVAGGLALADRPRAQETAAPGSLGEVPLPGGVDRARAVLHDPVSADRSQFLLEFIRRTHHSPLRPSNDAREPKLRALINQLESAAAATSADTVPLPLTAELWTDVILRAQGRGDQSVIQRDQIVVQIVRSRNASLLYYGLLELDDETRAWLAGERDLLREMATEHASAFVAAAPGIRVSGGAMRLPGGARAAAAWQEVVGRPANEAAAFIRAVLVRGQGRLAYFLGSMAQLTPEQVALAFSLDADDPSVHAAAAQRLYRIHERLAGDWRVENRAFWRPQLDPALLVADLGTGEHGRPFLPGSRAFWTMAFADGRITAVGRNDAGASGAAEGPPADFAWICEQVFEGDPSNEHRRYQRILFASRVVRRIGLATVQDAIDAVRGAAAFPALTATLERAGVADVATFAAAVRRAGRLSEIGDTSRAARALSQFQGALALISRAARRGGVPAPSLPGLITSLSALEISERGDYEGRLVGWLEARLRELSPRGEDPPRPVRAAADEMLDRAPGPVERQLLALLAGPVAKPPRFVEWEGQRYRLDFALAEAARLTRLLGEQAPPYLSSAASMIAVADALEQKTLTRDTTRIQLEVLNRIAGDVALDDGEAWMGTGVPRRYRDALETLRRATEGQGPGAAARVAPAIRLLADDLLARGLRVIVYSVAFGMAERTAATAADAAAHHDFGFGSARGAGPGPWHLPAQRAGDTRGWRVIGSLLGLDVRLAQHWLISLSAKPPPRRPTLNGEDRRVLEETVVLMEPSSLTDGDRDTIVRAMQKGRTRLASLRTAADSRAIADEIRLGPARRSLLPWVVTHDTARATGFLSPSELLWLGLEGLPVDVRLNEWGVPAEPRLGCLCLQLLDRRPWESFAGRWNAGLIASGFPDLNLRLSELLAEMRMPAPLLAPVLASAVLDFVNSVTSRDQDDRRGLVEFAQRLESDRVELYLALLTTDGPLVPSEETGTGGSGGNGVF
jgi:hypothetical protein